RRRRRAGEGDPDRQRPPGPPLPTAGADRELALLARRADRALVEPPDGLRGVPALGPAAALSRLRGLRRGGRPARAHRLRRRLHPYLVGRAAPSTARHRRGARVRRLSRLEDAVAVAAFCQAL